jgi:protein KRI1
LQERAFSAVAVAKAKAKAALAADAAKDDEEEPSEGEEDDDGEIDEKTQAQIFETLMKIRSRDQSIYDKEAKFYSSESEEEEAGPAGKREHPCGRAVLCVVLAQMHT